MLLNFNPAGIYSRLDFNTRDRCRRAIEDLHRGSGLAEDEVAQRALDLAAQTDRDSMADNRSNHVGTYLIGDRRADLARLIRCREALRFRALHWTYRHHSPVYFIGLGTIFFVLVSLLVHYGLHGENANSQLLVALLLLIPASQLSLEVMNYLLMRLLPPRTLPGARNARPAGGFRSFFFCSKLYIQGWSGHLCP